MKFNTPGKNFLTTSVLLLLTTSSVFANVKLASVFNRRMVLQHNAIVPLWEPADPGEKVTVQLDKQSVSAVADANGKWEVVSPQTVRHLSAAAYFFARDLQKKLNMPIGLIATVYGASTAEAWIGEESFLNDERLKSLLGSFKTKLAKYTTDSAAQNVYRVAYEKWKVDAAKAKAEGKDKVRAPGNADPVRDQHNATVLENIINLCIVVVF